MARLIIALIRHGDYQQLENAPSAHQPFPLTTKGEQQSRAAALKIWKTVNDRGWSLEPTIDCSHLLRAWQTAEIIGSELSGLLNRQNKLCQTQLLAERSLGLVANLTVAQIELLLAQDPRYSSPPPDWKSNSDYQLPFAGAESLMASGERVANHIKASVDLMAARISTNTLKLFVGHGAAFRHAAYQLGVLEFEQIAKLSMFHADPIYIERENSNRWRHIGGHWKVRERNAGYTD